MKKDWRFNVCYYGCLTTALLLLPKIPLLAQDLAFHPILLVTWILILRGLLAVWQDVYRFWRWHDGNQE